MEETQEGPKWLKELEEKREKRLKARLGHEAGAGSPCLTCEEKCPGLDLHFWRKICKNCKCGKENHDVNDDDIYGWAQFQLLGSKPSKAKKIVLPGRKDAVELEWTPKGQNEVVESYLKDLPVNLLPIKGSAAAQERKQLLQKQIPLHDIDPTMCHALSENEIKQMNDYIAHVKQNSVGVGHIMKLNELLKNRQSAANAQVLASRAPMQVPQVQNIVLQGVDRTNSLKAGHGGHGGDLQKALKDLSLDEQKLLNVSQGEQVASNANTIRDVAYDTYGQGQGVSDNLHANPLIGGVGTPQNAPNFSQISQPNVKNVQMPLPDLKNMQMPQQPIANQIDYQNSSTIGGIFDIKYPCGTHEIPNPPVNNEYDYQNFRGIRYPYINQNADSKLGQIPNHPIYAQIVDPQKPSNFRSFWDMNYPESIWHQNQSPHTQAKQSGEMFPANFAQVHPRNVQNLPHYAKSSVTNLENTQKPVEYDIRNVYPDMNVNFDPHISVGDLGANPELLDNVTSLKGDAKMPHYVPGKFNTFVEQQNPQKIGNVKDLAYSTYDPGRSSDVRYENWQKCGEKNFNLPLNLERCLNSDFHHGKHYDSVFDPEKNFSSAFDHEKNYNQALNPLKNSNPGFDPEKNFNPVFDPEKNFSSAFDHEKHYNQPFNPVKNSNPGFDPEKNFNPVFDPEKNFGSALDHEKNYNTAFSPANSSNPGFDPAKIFNPVFDPEKNFGLALDHEKDYNAASNPVSNPGFGSGKNSNPAFSPEKNLNPIFNPENVNRASDRERDLNPALKPGQHFNPALKPGQHFNPTEKNFSHSLNPQRPANYNPNEINVVEQSLNPTSVSVGIINDIEYPTIKSAIEKQNNIFEPEVPRKNVQFDLNPQEILPSCHKCKKMFDATAIVIGIDRTDALWHAECFKCTGCNQNLVDLMYFYDKESDDVYCGRDYAKIRGIPRCQACDELIFVKEYCLAENSTFHVKHFCCFECDLPLAGQNYVMEDSQPLCLPCFEKLKAEKCNACLSVIKPDEQGANLNGVHFHADDNCFACRVCKKPLLGAKLLFKNRNLYCSAPCFAADK